MIEKIVILTPFEGSLLGRLLAIYPEGRVKIARTLDEVAVEIRGARSTLLSFGAGEIVPAAILRDTSHAYNLHAGPPDFPGRDPHHHAVYRGAATFGATLHRMSEKVDAGTIVGVEYFDVGEHASPQHLLQGANEAGLRLLERIGDRLLDVAEMPALEVQWGSIKTKRLDLLALSKVSPLISEQEFSRRERAVAFPGRRNLHTRIHGRTFRVDPEASQRNDNSRFSEFTESGFTAILDALISGGYRFVAYGHVGAEPHVLWRHDIDFSVHRAARLAEIEQARGVRATYFVNLRSAFYNLMEPVIATKLAEIADRGHDIGLHFEGSPKAGGWTRNELEKAIGFEKGLLESLIDRPVNSISWHNPDQTNLLEFQDEVICGAHNTYSARLRERYVYCSDSNGYWRHAPMHSVVAGGHPRLHLLTHPAWWTPISMSPDERIDRALIGRARAVREQYDALLQKAGRRP